jgi:hypothetical protein
MTALERAAGLGGNGSSSGSDFTGRYLDTYVIIQPSGQCSISWSQPQHRQPDAPVGAECDGDINADIRLFRQDMRELTARRIPSEFLFRRAKCKIEALCGAALGAGPDDSDLRRELRDQRDEVKKAEREQLSSLGISLDEIEAAFEEWRMSCERAQ